jgi:hypothetical protein
MMYLMNRVTVRTGKIRLLRAVQRGPNTNAALELIGTEIEPELQELVNPEEAKAL